MREETRAAPLGRVHRRAARVLLVAPDERVLLMQFEGMGGQRFWITPGGGLEPGETFEQAAHRELAEELGLTALTLTPAWEETSQYSYRGVDYEQDEQVFLLRVASAELPPNLEERRLREGMLATHWWALDEVEARSEEIYPRDLAARARRAMAPRADIAGAP